MSDLKFNNYAHKVRNTFITSDDTQIKFDDKH